MKTGTKVMGWVTVAVLAMTTGTALAAKSVTKKEISGVVNLNTATEPVTWSSVSTKCAVTSSPSRSS